MLSATVCAAHKRPLPYHRTLACILLYTGWGLALYFALFRFVYIIFSAPQAPRLGAETANHAAEIGHDYDILFP